MLEIGCGTLRILLPTARAGVTIAGLDASPAMLDRCREKLAAEPASVRDRVMLREGDARAFSLGRTFALITVPFRAFQHAITRHHWARARLVRPPHEGISTIV